jgi:hypothetical protein
MATTPKRGLYYSLPLLHLEPTMLNMKKSMLVIAAFSGLVTINACKKDSTDYAAQATCTGTTPTYNGEISSIINTHCGDSNCHNASSSKAGINLSTYALASSQFLNNNDILTSIHHGRGVSPMPDNKPQLSSDIINKLDCWVKNGCPQ